MGLLGALLLRSLFLHNTQHFLAPHQAKAKTMPRSFPYPYLFLSRMHKQISILSGRCSWGFQSCHPLEAALPFRFWGVLFLASMLWFRETCAMLHWIMVESREAQSQESGLSIQPSEKQKSAFLVTVQFNSKHLP